MKTTILILITFAFASSAFATMVSITNKQSGVVCYQFTCDTGPKAGFQSDKFCDDKGWNSSAVMNRADGVCGRGNSKIATTKDSKSTFSNLVIKKSAFGQ